MAYNILLKRGLEANYHALASPVPNAVYFCTDTGNIYFNGKLTTGKIVFEKPATGVAGTIYIANGHAYVWNGITYTDFYSDFVGATTDVTGRSGLVPAPDAGSHNKFLRGDGTWGTPEDTKYGAAGTDLGLVKSGGDVTISNGVITVNDDSHNHTIANVDGLQSALDGKVSTTGTAAKATADDKGNIIASSYIKSLSVNGKVITITKGDNTTSTINTQDTTYSDMTGASASAAGTHGLVPAPAAGKNTAFLRGDGTWATPTDTKYDAAGTSLGLVKSGGDVTITDGVVTVNDNSHAHTIDNVTGLQSALDNLEASIDYIENGSTIVPKATSATKATQDAAGNNIQATYIKGVSISGKTITITKGDDTTSTLTTQDTTYSDMTGASASAAGTHGLVPAPGAGKNGSFLRGDGTWAVPTNTTYDPAGASFGLVKSGGDVTITDGVITVNDDSHAHTIANVDGLQSALDGKLGSTATAAAASKLAASKNFSISGGATASAVGFNGSGDVNLVVTALDASKLTGTISIDRLPAGALERLVPVANQAARFALTTADVQLGDTVQELDTKLMYIVTDVSKLSSAAGYTEYTAGSASSVPWTGITGKPSTFAPSAHGHATSEIDGLDSSISSINTEIANIKSGTTIVGKATKDSANQQISSTYIKGLSANGKTITITKGDGTTSSITTQDTTYSAAGSALGLVKSGGDVTITDGVITVNDDSHAHTIANVDGLQTELNSLSTSITNITNGTTTVGKATSATSATSAASATKATQDAGGNNIQSTYIKGVSISGKTITVTKGDNTTSTLTTQDTTYSDMTGASASAAGTHGLVPAPAAGKNTSFLRGDGTWAVPTNTTYEAAGTDLGLVKSGGDVTIANGTITVNDDSHNHTIANVDGLQSHIDRSRRVIEITLTAAGWSGSAAPYSQTVTNSNILSTDNPQLCKALVDGATAAQQTAYEKAFGIISGGTGTTADGSVTFKVYKKPESDIVVGLMGY